MKKLVGTLLMLSLSAAVFVGCNQQATTPDTPTGTSSAPAVDGSKYLLASEPDGVQDVIQVREAAQDQEEIVIVGRIGGRSNPWVEGRAAFSIVDGSLKACSDIPGDECPQPWDYCCETAKLPTSMALVKILDTEGNLIKTDARQLLNVKELQTVVVRGTAQRDEAGNLTVLASGVHVRK